MENLHHVLTWYPLFGIPAGIAWVAVYVSAGKRFDLQTGDKALLVLPWLGLYLASVLWPGEKSLANLLEVVVVAAFVPLALLARAVLGRERDQARLAWRLAWGIAAFSIVLWWLVPVIPF